MGNYTLTITHYKLICIAYLTATLNSRAAKRLTQAAASCLSETGAGCS